MRPALLMVFAAVSAFGQTAPAWRLDYSAFDTPQGASRPVLVTAQYKANAADLAGLAVSVSFDVSEQGVPENIQIVHAPDAASADEVVQMIREWRFKAALRNGIPVAARGFLEFSIANANAGPDAGTSPVAANGTRPRPRKKMM